MTEGMNTGYKAEVLADSITLHGCRLTTIKTRYPRFLHPEMLRHRAFSHSVASNRAIPTEHLIAQVRQDPFIPSEFNVRVPGMGVGDPLDIASALKCEEEWRWAARTAADHVEALMDLGLDKSRANRLLEPFQWIHDIVSATEWDNFFGLRLHPAAQPEFQILAQIMANALGASAPILLANAEWHLPLVDMETEDVLTWETAKLVSASRCARVSYDRTDDEPLEKTVARARKLLEAGHLSPFEHVAMPAPTPRAHGNFRGWIQMRKSFRHEDRFDLLIKDRELST